ncbi:MAG: class I SAM-dependent methyltransferase [Flavobacteriales bacterium]|nr:class I SAM-dependent methyltransferase [Flavobacteriales bacterium]
MSDDNIFEMAPCLKDGPLSAKGLPFVKQALELPKSVSSDIIKTWATYYIFIAKESAFRKEVDPTNEILEALENQRNFLAAFNNLNLEHFATSEAMEKSRASMEEVERETGNHYGNLFKKFDAEKYFQETHDLLKTRLEVNNILPENLSEMTVLDAGCGGGRYSAAWKKLGAKEVTGVDFSEIGISSAKDRIKEANIDVNYQLEDVVNLSFQNDTFDIVFSNGVLHHTRDLDKGIHELVRVMKKDGFGWLYLIENPGGYFWDIIEILRVIMADVDNGVARNALRILGVPANRIFYILDHIMVPINLRLTGDEIIEILEKHGAKDVKRLERGYGFDRIEKIYQKEPFAEMKYGVGEHRYVFTK